MTKLWEGRDLGKGGQSDDTSFLAVDRDLREAGEEEEEAGEEKGRLTWYLSPPSGSSVSRAMTPSI